MRESFQWSRRGDCRIIAELLDTQESNVNPPEEGTDVQGPCKLILFTHVAKVAKPIEHFGFVAQDFQARMHHRFFNIHSTLGDGSDCAGILLDSGTHNSENEYKIACIGKGQRCQPMQPWFDHADGRLEWVVLLLEHGVDGYERIGLTTVQPDEFEWTLEWINIV